MSSEDSLDDIIMAMEDKVAQQTDKVNTEVDLLKEMRINLQQLKVKKQRKTGVRKLESLLQFMEEVSQETKERARKYRL